MRIHFIDDSVTFDPFMPATQPLGGAEKVLTGLPAALAGRGHDVTVINRCRYPVNIGGVRWPGWDAPKPLETDVLVAWRKPSLLGAVRKVGKRLLWLAAPAAYIERASNQPLLKELAPRLIFQGPIHRATWSGKPNLPAFTLPPAAREAYLEGIEPQPASPPRAIVTTHPAHGLDWLLELWIKQIRPAAPEAELWLYSALLDRGLQGAELPEEMRPLLAKVKEAGVHGLRVAAPMGDSDMAQSYRTARVHLYPGHAEDMACFSLVETQACGLPAVARPLGATRERIRDGQTGYIAPDDAAFANVAISLLSDDAVYQSLSRDAALLQRSRTYEVAAAEFEAALG